MPDPIALFPKSCASPLHNAPFGTPDESDPDGVYVTDCAHVFPYLVEQLQWRKNGVVQLWYRHGTDERQEEVYVVSPQQARYGAVAQLWGMLHARLMAGDPPKPGQYLGRDLGERMAAMRAVDVARADVLLSAVPEADAAALSDEDRVKLERFAVQAAEAMRTGVYECAGCGAEVPVERAVIDEAAARVVCEGCRGAV